MFLEYAIGCAICYCAYKYFKPDPLSRIPGPKGWPILGNTFQVDFTKPHTSFTNWAKQYGSVYKVNIAGSYIVMVSGTEFLNEILVKRGTDFANRIKSFRIQIQTDNYSNTILHDYNDKFKFMKKLMFKGLKQHNLKHIESITLDVVDDLLQDIRELDEEPFEPSEYIHATLYKILFIMVFSHKVDSSAPEFKDLRNFIDDTNRLQSFEGSHALLDFFPWLRFFGNKTYTEIMENRNLHQILYDKYKMQVKTGGMDGGWFKDLLEIHENNPESLSEINVTMMFMEFFIAGSATTSATILPFLNMMAHKQEVQQRLQAEVDAKIENNGQIAFGDRDEMPYLFACILEVLRYFTIVYLGVPHQTAVDTSIGQYAIPKDTQVFTNLYAQHHDPDLFPQPLDFLPERFLTPNGKVVAAGEEPRKHLYPFGAGVRVCAGETLAMTRLFIIFARIVQHFTILPATTIEEQASIHPHDFTYGVILVPQPYKIRMIKRQ